MSWELSSSDCPYKDNKCGNYLDDWNRWETRLCNQCEKDKKDERYRRDLEISKRDKRCLECVKLDSSTEGLGHSWFNKRECKKCWTEQVLNPFIDKYKIDQNISIYKNELLIKEYNEDFPKNKGFQTKKFYLWIDKKIPLKYKQKWIK